MLSWGVAEMPLGSCSLTSLSDIVSVDSASDVSSLNKFAISPACGFLRTTETDESLGPAPLIWIDLLKSVCWANIAAPLRVTVTEL